MDTFVVVVVELLVDSLHEFRKCGEAVDVSQLFLESTKERLLVAILPWVGFVAVGGKNTVGHKPESAFITRILAPLVRMKQLWYSCPFLFGVFQGSNDQTAAVMKAKGDANNFTGILINDGSEIHVGAVP